MAKAKTYGDAGVSLETADAIADGVPKLLASTFRKGCIPLPGGFAGLFDLKREGLGDCILVLSTDGVGTKIKLGIDYNMPRGLGIDLVAMSVNDVITLGAKPLCFLDYFASGKIDKTVLMQVLEGVADGCRQSGCALMGGETAEMPGMYQKGDFDLAGFCVGAVARDKMVDGTKVKAGDRIIGLPSSGVHSNGYSLVRAILEDLPAAEVKPQIEALLVPTRLYAATVGNVCDKLNVHGMAHITGGGLAGNVTRVIPDGLIAKMRWGSWNVPQVFQWLQQKGNVAQDEMLRVFNMGIGYVFIVDAADEKDLLKLLGGEGTVIGEVVPGAALPGDMKACVE